MDLISVIFESISERIQPSSYQWNSNNLLLALSVIVSIFLGVLLRLQIKRRLELLIFFNLLFLLFTAPVNITVFAALFFILTIEIFTRTLPNSKTRQVTLFMISATGFILLVRPFQESSSFFVFGGLGYFVIKLVEILKERNAHNTVSRIAYLTFWIPFYGGPILRFNDFTQQASVSETRPLFYICFRFFIGSVKIVLLSALFSDLTQIFKTTESLKPYSFLFIYFNFFRIYFEFSGYTDCAISLGHLIGFRLPENFSKPYFAESISDFWNKWHISLTHWLRDHVFFPVTKALTKKAAPQPWILFLSFNSVCLSMALFHGFGLKWIFYAIWNGSALVLDHYLFNYFERVFKNSRFFIKKLFYLFYSLFSLTTISIGFLLMNSVREFSFFWSLLIGN